MVEKHLKQALKAAKKVGRTSISMMQEKFNLSRHDAIELHMEVVRYFTELHLCTFCNGFIIHKKD